MSAIAGILCLDHGAVDLPVAERMAAAWGGEVDSYRSPEGRCALAALGAAQPLANETLDMWLVLDGEIVNSRALRHTLELVGHRFRTNSDAEVALHAYEQWELDFPAHLQGAFALALWDDRRDRLVLARDRLGRKPLFVAEHRGRLAFASAIRPLLEGMELPRRLDPAGLAHYLTFGAVPAPATLVAGMGKLAGGEALVAERHAPPARHRWQALSPEPNRAQAVRALPAERHAGSLRTLLECSVADRLPGRVGAWLTPAAPAAAIAAIATRLTGNPPSAVALTTSDEDAIALDVLGRMAGLAVRDVRVGPDDVAAALPGLAARLPEPVADSGLAAGWLAAGALAEHKVESMLADAGADALLLGHPLYAAMGPRWAARLRRWLTGHKPPRPLPAGLGLGRLANVALPAIVPPCQPVPPWAESDAAALRGLDDLALQVCEGTAPGLNAAAQAHGLEARLPFLDDTLAEYALAIPGRHRAGAAMRGIFAELARNAPATAPALPLAAWLAGPLAELVGETTRRLPLLDSRAVTALLAAHRTQPIHTDRLWALMVLAEWCAALGLTEVAESTGMVEVEA